MTPIDDAVSEGKDGIVLAVEVTPGAKRDLFPAGFNPWRKTIGCRVAAPALEGRANVAVVSVIAESLGVPRKAVQIQSGATSSLKKVRVAGMKKRDCTARIKSMLEK